MKLKQIKFKREVNYNIKYKGVELNHRYITDFIIDDKIVLELKALEALNNNHIKQTLNYLAASKLKLGLLINFGEDS